MITSSRLRDRPQGRTRIIAVPIAILLLSLVSDTTLAAPHYRRSLQHTDESRHVLREDSLSGVGPPPGSAVGPTTTIAFTVGGGPSPTIGLTSPNGSGSGDSADTNLASAQGGTSPVSPLGSLGEGDPFSFTDPKPISPAMNAVASALSNFPQTNNNGVPPGRGPSPVVFVVENDQDGSQQEGTPVDTQDHISALPPSALGELNAISVTSPGPNLIHQAAQQVEQQEQTSILPPNVTSGRPVTSGQPPATTAVVDDLPPKSPVPAMDPPSTIQQPILSSPVPSPPPAKQPASLVAEASTTPSAPTIPLAEIPPSTPPASTPPSTPVSPEPEAIEEQAQTAPPPPPSETITKTLSIRLTTVATTVTHLVTVTETLTPSTSSSIPPTSSSSTATTASKPPSSLDESSSSSNSTMNGGSSSITIGSVSIEALLASSMRSSSTLLTTTRGNGTSTATTTMTATDNAGSGYRENYLYRQQYRPLTAS